MPVIAAVPPAICLMGPTASGKTALALALCERFPCEVISVDSALIYRGMDIGTAKPTPAELAAVPHHLIDIRDPSESYSAADFCRDALGCMDDITARGRLPLLVGGTMLYFRALRDGLAALPSSDPAVRAAILAEAAQQGWPALHAELARVDPIAAARLHPNHSQRIQRALEVYRISGVPLSQLQERGRQSPLRHRLLELAIAPLDRALLHQRIAQRLRQMLADGFLDEVRALRARGDLDPDSPALRSVGYRQAWRYLDGNGDAATFEQEAVIATRQLAKRQLTWLRQWPALTWLLTDAEQRLATGAEQGRDAAAVAAECIDRFLVADHDVAQ